jgi:hypothetical protein
MMPSRTSGARTVFDRYRIVPERDLREGLAKLAEKTPAGEKVVPVS